MMERTITIQDFRHAIAYVNNEHFGGSLRLQSFSDEQLLNSDLTHDLNIGNIRLTNILNELRKMHNVNLPSELAKVVPDNRVKSLLDTINFYLREAEKMTQS